jgi:hypothetical protein
MVTWEDLDSESGSEKEEAEEDAKVVMGLVATETSEAHPDSDSEDENEVYSKIPREELVESFKELLTHFELRIKKHQRHGQPEGKKYRRDKIPKGLFLKGHK